MCGQVEEGVTGRVRGSAVTPLRQPDGGNCRASQWRRLDDVAMQVVARTRKFASQDTATTRHGCE